MRNFAFFYEFERIDLVLLCSAVLLFLVGSYGLYTSENAMKNSTSIAIGTIYTQGKVRRRQANSLKWETFGTETKVYLRDMIYTPKNTWAEFRWGNGNALKLEPDSMVQFDEIHLDRLEIQILGGRVREHVASKNKVLMNQKQEPMPLLPTRFYLEKNNPFTLEELKAQSLDLEARLQTILHQKVALLPTKLLKKVDSLQIQLTDYIFSLLSPVGKVMKMSAKENFELSWTRLPLEHIKYRLEISRSEIFKQFISYDTLESKVSLRLLRSGKYYWRVKASDGVREIKSKASDFSILLTDTPEEIPRQISKVPPPPPVYVYEVAREENFAKVLQRAEAKKPECDLTGLLLGEYYCRVFEKETGKKILEKKVRTP